MSEGVITTALKHLIAAGLSGDALLRAVADIESAMQPRRSRNAERQAAWRERQNVPEIEAEDATNNVTDATDATAHNGTEVSPKKLKSIPPSHSPPISPPFPIPEALAAWNEMAKRAGLPEALSATGKRQAAMRQRIAEHGEAGFRKAVEAVERSKFCRGENDRGWRADIGFLLRPDNFVKLLEGGYDPKGATPIGRAANRPMNLAELRSAIAFAEDNNNPDRAAELKAQLERLTARQPPGQVGAIVRQAAKSIQADAA